MYTLDYKYGLERFTSSTPSCTDLVIDSAFNIPIERGIAFNVKNNRVFVVIHESIRN